MEQKSKIWVFPFLMTIATLFILPSTSIATLAISSSMANSDISYVNHCYSDINSKYESVPISSWDDPDCPEQ